MSTLGRAMLTPILLGTVIASLPACTLKATLDTTSDGITNFLSSTSGKTWFTEDGLVREDLKVEAFAWMNYENLKQDMARGSGEYLSSLGSLMSVPPDRQTEFLAFVQQRYPVLVGGDRTTPGTMLALLKREWTARSAVR
ncbi:MAG: hypothetical protein KatS3mg082_2040 [Nitrospiraceae bacterium]|jgi:hypothetical protein|nr:MAG: hypothetical protein KatS3mg082_2040 [Nitrospiraceae bacterium]